MRTAHPNRIFFLLLGIGLAVMLVTATATYRIILAGCPDNCMVNLTCLLLPTHLDMGVHFLGYLFIGTILLLTAAGLILWLRQRNRTVSLVSNLAITSVSDGKLDKLLLRVEKTATKWASFLNIILIPISAIPYLLGMLGEVYLITSITIGLVILFPNIKLFFTPTRQRAWTVLKFQASTWLLSIWPSFWILCLGSR